MVFINWHKKLTFNNIGSANFLSFKDYLSIKFWFVLFLIVIYLQLQLGVFLRDLINIFNIYPKENLSKVAIYGTGQIEAQLSKQILLTGSHNLITFIDDNSDLWNRNINGIEVNSLEKNIRIRSR